MKLRNLFILLLLTPGLCFALALRKDAPSHYTVKRGDSLWSISSRFLEQPWQWKELWNGNPPAKLYPGAEIVLRRQDSDHPYIQQVSRISGTRLSPRIRRSSVDNSIPPIPLAGIKPFLNDSRIFTRDELAYAPYVVSFAGNHLMGGPGNEIYVIDAPPLKLVNETLANGNQINNSKRCCRKPGCCIAKENRYMPRRYIDKESPYMPRHYVPKERESVAYSRYVTNRSSLTISTAAVDSKWVIYRPNGQYVDPETKQVLGYMAKKIGQAQVEEQGNPATMLITEIDHGVSPKDRLLPPEANPYPPVFIPHAPRGRIRGEIIDMPDAISQLGANQVVVINLGKTSGLLAGDVLAIYQPSYTVPDPLDEKHLVIIPQRRLGELMVFRTFNRTSFGLVVRAIEPIHMAYLLRNP